MPDAPAVRRPSHWGPDGRRAAISLTFDHLGEANEVEQGRWPVGEPVGQHYSVREVLPRILDLLDREQVQATFYVEGWNTLVYPDALHLIVRRGHELGYHGWRHERWSTLSPAEELRLMRLGMTELHRLGLPVTGFRTPGGGHSEATFQGMRQYGLTYLSDESLPAGIRDDGFAQQPYDWRAVDAFYFSARLTELRERHGETADVLPTSRFAAALDGCIEQFIDERRSLGVLFHPFLLREPDRWALLEETVRRLARDERVWCVPTATVAAWLRDWAATTT